MKVESFMVMLLLCSTLTSLATEAVKKILTEHGKSYHANTLAGCCSLAVSFLVWSAQVALAGFSVTAVVVARLVALIFLAWLCAMVGYDKVIQSIYQIIEKEDEQ